MKKSFKLSTHKVKSNYSYGFRENKYLVFDEPE